MTHSTPESRPNSPTYRWTVLGIIMMGTFMAILDMSIVNVAMPQMMSAFGVTRDKIEWVATAFMIASATAMPLVGWLTGRVGYKALYLTSLLIFILGSAACAMAWSYESLIVARVIQAIGGGAIQPVGMAIVADLFEPHERGKALGIWGTGIMVAPALGPTLGGYLTEVFNWRSIFSVNLPIGVVTLLAGLVIMRQIGARGRGRKLDVWGYVFLAMMLVSSLIALSNGQDKGWDSTYIRTCFALSVVGLVMFVAVELSVKEPLLNLGLFKYRNYTLALLLAVSRAIGLFGGVFLMPIFLQNLAGYTTIQAGIWMMPGALAVGLTMPIAGRLADRYPPRALVTAGCLMVGASLLVYGRFDPLSSRAFIVFPQLLRGAGLAFMMAPLVTAALNAVPREDIPTASSFINVAQNVGGSFGIAILNNHVTNSIHAHAVSIGERFPRQSQEFTRFAGRAAGIVVRDAPGIMATTEVKSGFAAATTIFHRAQVLGFDSGFVYSGMIIIASVPLCLLLKGSAHHGKKGGMPALSE